MTSYFSMVSVEGLDIARRWSETLKAQQTGYRGGLKWTVWVVLCCVPGRVEAFDGLVLLAPGTRVVKLTCSLGLRSPSSIARVRGWRNVELLPPECTSAWGLWLEVEEEGGGGGTSDIRHALIYNCNNNRIYLFYVILIAKQIISTVPREDLVFIFRKIKQNVKTRYRRNK